MRFSSAAMFLQFLNNVLMDTGSAHCLHVPEAFSLSFDKKLYASIKEARLDVGRFLRCLFTLFVSATDCKKFRTGTDICVRLKRDVEGAEER